MSKSNNISRQWPNDISLSRGLHIENTFNVFFTNIWEKIANGIDYVGSNDYNFYLNK